MVSGFQELPGRSPANVLPASAGDYPLDLAFAQQVTTSDARDGFAEEMCSSYRADIVLTQSGAMMLGSNGAPLPILGHLVAHILGMCSKEEVRWITAESIIATVQDVESLWNPAACQGKRRTVCSFDDSDIATLSSSCDTVYSSVSAPSGPGPNPTFVSVPTPDTRPEVFCEFDVAVLSHSTEHIAVATREV